MKPAILFLFFSLLAAGVTAANETVISEDVSSFRLKREVLLELAPGPGNPRNSEGDFIRLKDGRILFVYSQYCGNSAGDHAQANLAQIVSSDEGKSWSQPEIIVRMEGGMNVMSVSLLRLRDGRIALFYLRKFSMEDCRTWVRFSADEGQSWSDAVCCMKDADYFVVNNARIVQLRNGFILIPAALHHFQAGRNDFSGEALCFLSRDGGRTFQRGELAAKPKGLVFQEPGVVELEDGSLFMHVRTTSGTQFGMKSSDFGQTWGPAEPTRFVSPCSPMLIRPIPGTHRFLAVWNENPKGRNPLTLAVLDSELKFLWKETLDQSVGEPPQWFCYPAILALNEREFLIAYCAGIMPNVGLEKTRIVKVTLAPELPRK